MNPVLAPECALDERGSGVYERVASDEWWAQASLHGGYVLALAMEAVKRELGRPGWSLQHLALHYLRPFSSGRVRIEVDVEKVGRRLSNATVTMHSGDKLAGTGLASVAQGRSGDADVDLVHTPTVAPYDPAANDPSPSSVPIHGKVWMQARDIDGTGQDSATVGGWVAPRTPETIDHRWLAVLADLWMPAVYRRWDMPRASSTVDISYHVRSTLPREDLPPGSPILVSLTNRQCRGGFVDEDVELWSPGGVLLAQSRQMRMVRGVD